MSYSTTLQFAERSGLGTRLVNENVGTGDGSVTSFDLDNGNVIADSYELKYASEGSNDFTDLVETTDYFLDKEGGTIELTSAGVTALGTNILYATYWYVEDFSDNVISDFINSADDELNKLTGRKWNSSNSAVEYHDGRSSSKYPTTDEPFVRDWDEPDSLMLNSHPVIKVDNVYFLSPGSAIGCFFNYDASGTSYSDKTTEVNSSTEAPFTLFASIPAQNDIVYVGMPEVFLGVDTNLSVVGVKSGQTIDWEYYNGSSWTDLSESDVDTGASTFTASGKFSWSYPYGWAKTSVNGKDYYWIRGKLGSAYDTAPVCATMSVNDLVSTVLEPRQFTFEDWGKLNFLGKDIPDGTMNIRVDYSYGLSTVPTYIVDLSIILASIRAYVNLSGGSYDDATSYTLGGKSVSIGEVYVNIERVMIEFKKRKQELLDLIGSRANVGGI